MSGHEDAWDDWETAADAGLADFKKPKTTPEMTISTNKKQSTDEANANLWNQANQYATPTIIRTDTIQTQYQPEIKILKRSNDAPRGHHQGTKAGTTPVKSLAEREKDYALARNRIFGQHQSTPDNTTTNTNNKNKNSSNSH